MYLLASKFRFLGFRLLLSRVAPYYSSLPRTVWISQVLICCKNQLHESYRGLVQELSIFRHDTKIIKIMTRYIDVLFRSLLRIELDPELT